MTTFRVMRLHIAVALALMAEPAHRKIAALGQIGSGNNLDTGPGAYHALWSADSRHVAVWFRSGRHVAELNLYRTEKRPHLIWGPSLFREAISRDLGANDDLRESSPAVRRRRGDGTVLAALPPLPRGKSHHRGR
jgi:hypothetical protein